MNENNQPLLIGNNSIEISYPSWFIKSDIDIQNTSCDRNTIDLISKNNLSIPSFTILYDDDIVKIMDANNGKECPLLINGTLVNPQGEPYKILNIRPISEELMFSTRTSQIVINWEAPINVVEETNLIINLENPIWYYCRKFGFYLYGILFAAIIKAYANTKRA